MGQQEEKAVSQPNQAASYRPTRPFMSPLTGCVYLFYTLGLLLSLLVMLPYFLYQALRYNKYHSTFSQRLGRRLPPPTSQPTIWVHAVSVGETLAVEPLLHQLHERVPAYRLIVSTTTETGQAVARRRLSKIAQTIYFPFDFAFCIRRALNQLAPSLVLITETEIWPNFLRACHQYHVPVILINGRISDRSFRGYYALRRYMAGVLDQFSLLLMQSQRDAERARQLGAPSDRVVVTGNLKYDLMVPDLRARVSELDHQFDLTHSRLIVAGSTARGEEQLLLEAFATLLQQPETGHLRLLLAPRHPERFDEVAALIAQAGFSFARRSQPSDTTHSRTCPVILLDTVGELTAAYAAADIVFVGGSLVPVGGHNILEPALFGKPTVVGPYTSNFQAIVQEFIHEEALIQLTPPDTAPYPSQLFDVFRSLILDEPRRQKLGQKARNLLERNRGATDRTLKLIAGFLDPLAASHQHGCRRAGQLGGRVTEVTGSPV